MMQSREDAPKPQFGQFFDDFSKLQIFLKNNFRPKTKKILRAIFEKNIEVYDFGLIWRLFREYLQIKNFFQKSGSVTFLPL